MRILTPIFFSKILLVLMKKALISSTPLTFKRKISGEVRVIIPVATSELKITSIRSVPVKKITEGNFSKFILA